MVEKLNLEVDSTRTNLTKLLDWEVEKSGGQLVGLHLAGCLDDQ